MYDLVGTPRWIEPGVDPCIHALMDYIKQGVTCNRGQEQHQHADEQHVFITRAGVDDDGVEYHKNGRRAQVTLKD